MPAPRFSALRVHSALNVSNAAQRERPSPSDRAHPALLLSSGGTSHDTPSSVLDATAICQCKGVTGRPSTFRVCVMLPVDPLVSVWGVE